jgi:hypothetical protein
MQGYVLVFRPVTGDGTIVTDSGAEVRFTSHGAGTELQGGDIVSFRMDRSCGGTAPSTAGDVQVLQKWSDRLATTDRQLLQELHSIVQIEAASP